MCGIEPPLEIAPMPARRQRCLVTALAILAVPGLAAPAAAGAGLVTPTIEVSAHRPDHGTGSVVQIGTLAHLEVIVRANGQPVTGDVLIVFWEAHGCQNALSYTGSAVPLENGEVDGPRAYGYDVPDRGSFQARYLGSQGWGPVTSACIDVTWKAPLNSLASVIHDSNHQPVGGTLAVGAQAHLAATLSGSHGEISGRLTIYRYANGTCSGNGTVHQSFTGDLDGSTDIGSEDYTYASPGLFAWQAYFNDSDRYLVKTGTCHPLRVKARPTISVSFIDATGSPVTSVQVGTEYRVKATVAGAFGIPTGSGHISAHLSAACTFQVGNMPVTFANGVALSSPQTGSFVGTLFYAARYDGDDTYLPASTTACVPLAITEAPSAPPTTAPPSGTPTTAPTVAPTSAPSGDPTPAASPRATVVSTPPAGSTAPTAAPASAGPGASSPPSGAAGGESAPPDGGATSLPGGSATSAAASELAVAGGISAAPADSGTATESLLVILVVVLLGLVTALGAALVAARRRPATAPGPNLEPGRRP